MGSGEGHETNIFYQTHGWRLKVKTIFASIKFLERNVPLHTVAASDFSRRDIIIIIVLYSRSKSVTVDLARSLFIVIIAGLVVARSRAIFTGDSEFLILINY